VEQETSQRRAKSGGAAVCLNGVRDPSAQKRREAAIGHVAGGNATLTLNASHDISFSAGADITSTTGALGLTLNAAGNINGIAPAADELGKEALPTLSR
jgi:hypothetical protein